MRKGQKRRLRIVVAWLLVSLTFSTAVNIVQGDMGDAETVLRAAIVVTHATILAELLGPWIKRAGNDIMGNKPEADLDA